MLIGLVVVFVGLILLILCVKIMDKLVNKSDEGQACRSGARSRGARPGERAAGGSGHFAGSARGDHRRHLRLRAGGQIARGCALPRRKNSWNRAAREENIYRF